MYRLQFHKNPYSNYKVPKNHKYWNHHLKPYLSIIFPYILPVNDIVLMEKLQAANDFGTVETGAILIKFSVLLYMKHEITTI